MANLYRKTLLDKMSSPEQLDKMIVVTPLSGWIGIVGTGLIVVAAIVWSIFGRIPTNVNIQGIYTYADGMEAAINTNALKADSEDNSNGLVVCYASATDGRKIKEGMKVQVYPTTVNRQEYGHMSATVESVDTYFTSTERMEQMLGNDVLVQSFLTDGPVIEVICRLEEDDSTISGYAWSSDKGQNVELEPGTLVESSVVIEEKAPITLVLPMLKDKLTVKAQD